MSITLIIPIYESIVDYQNIMNQNSNFIFDFLSAFNLNQNQIIISFFIILALTFIFKFLVYSFANKYSFHLIADLKTQISSKIFNDYANRDYIFFKQKSSSFIIRDLLIEVGEFCDRYIMSSIYLILEAMVIIVLFSFLFFVETKIALYFSIYIILVSLIYFKFIKKKILKAGELRSNTDEQKFSILQEFINNIKTIKVRNNEIFFSIMFKNYTKNYEYSFANFNYIQVLSKPVLEIFGILFVVSWLIINIYFNSNFNDLFLSVSIVLFVCFRALPSINKINFSIGQIRFAQPSIKIISGELDKLDNNRDIFNKKALVKFNKSISLHNIDFKYEENKKNIFDNFNFKICKGEKICILGKSGEGKTTLIELISGLLKPGKGKILIDEEKIYNPSSEYLNMSYMAQDLFLTNGTIESNIVFNQNTIDRVKLQKSIELAELSEFVNSQEKKELQKVGEFGGKLSGGQKQRIGIARCFYEDAEFIILDESLNAIDEKTRSKIVHNIFNSLKNKTMIFITHDINFSKNFDKKFVLKDGKLVFFN
jgi:ABC-type bacteriocin/lantibiotic exporter with double-glycine peptidase domain